VFHVLGLGLEVFGLGFVVPGLGFEVLALGFEEKFKRTFQVPAPGLQNMSKTHISFFFIVFLHVSGHLAGRGSCRERG